MGRAFLQGVHRGAHRGVAGDHDDFGVGGDLLDGLQELEAVHLLHLQVGEDDVELLGLDLFQGLQAVGRGGDLVAFLAQDVLQVGAGDLFVVHHQDLGGLEAAEGAHRQVLQDALLDVLQAVVLGFQEAFGPFQVQVVFGDAVPGQGDQVIQIIEADGVFRHRGSVFSRRSSSFAANAATASGKLGLLDRGPQVRQFLGRLGGRSSSVFGKRPWLRPSLELDAYSQSSIRENPPERQLTMRRANFLI